MTANTWHDKQERVLSGTFKPKWTPEIILSIIDRVNQMTDFIDLQYQLVKENNIRLGAAALWIEKARRVDTDMKNGLTIDEALERDRERGNLLRRKPQGMKG